MPARERCHDRGVAPGDLRGAPREYVALPYFDLREGPVKVATSVTGVIDNLSVGLPRSATTFLRASNCVGDGRPS